MTKYYQTFFLFVVSSFIICGFFCDKGFTQEDVLTNAIIENDQENEVGSLENEIENDAEEMNGEAEKKELETEPQVKPLSSKELVTKSWEASSKNDLKGLESLVNQCLERFGDEAKTLGEKLSAFPARGEETQYQALNDVATCLFIKAEALMNTGNVAEAITQFQTIIEQYPYAQAWDPRGWYWSVAEKSQDSIDVLTGKTEEELQKNEEKVVRTKPYLHTKGKKRIVDYTKYGEFQNVGTENYHYKINDAKALADAVGEGIYPNTGAIYNNPRYKEVKAEGRLEGNHWDYVNSDDLEAAYFKWVTAPEPWGVRLFYIGIIFEKAKMYYEALKAYHSLVVHYPKTVAWTYWQTPWYPGQAAIAKIRHIIRSHPELNLDTKWMSIEVKNGYDNDGGNDLFVTYPGKIIEVTFFDRLRSKFDFSDKVDLGKVINKRGNGKVRLEQYENKHWQLLVDNKPFVIKGITYAPTKIGQSPDKGTLANWMEEDVNENGRIDGPYDSWVDSNKNNIQDANEPVVGDFQLMKEMGANTLRIYHQPDKPNKELLRKMYKEYGFYVVMGDFLGKYAIGSGASWSEGTDYENPEHKKNMLESVKKMVMEFKDEPYILLWVLGNENNYGVASNADKKPEAYFKFVDEVAQWIKSVDPNHPVAVNNGDTLFLDIFAQNSPNVDIFTANVYRGDYGFGSFWEQVMAASGKAAFITEYGCPAYARHLSLDEAEDAQADYHRGNWLDIEENVAGNSRGVGNALGGIVFEWLDEWWKNYEPYLHDRKSDAIGPFPGGYYFEEWFGVVGQGNGQNSPFLRQPRKSYYLYKDLWN
ncbi:MAG: tetratricopeptide repeat protein [Candidatus Omnitrophica bacterium]|nr:tetratricopeptide repeat protein [Candidatus Omnitrophota bacterium]